MHLVYWDIVKLLLYGEDSCPAMDVPNKGVEVRDDDVTQK